MAPVEPFYHMSSAPVPPFAPGWRPTVRDDVDFRHVGGDWVLFDPKSQRIHVLDVAAALTWSHCAGELDVDALDDEIRRAFGAARTDTGVREALQTFVDAGLLKGTP